MIASLLILPSLADGEALLAERGADGRIDVQRGKAAVLTLTARRPLAVIVAGQFVRTFLTDLPKTIKSRDRINVARFAHEDQLAKNPSDLHIVVGSGTPAPTAFIDPDMMDQIVSAFDPQQIITDYDALADLGGADLFLLDRIVRPSEVGLALDPDWIDGRAASLPDIDIAAAIFARLDQAEALNLRTGPYQRRTQIALGPWVRVAALALMCGGLGLALTIADGRAKAAQADALNDEARALYTQMTGQAPPQPLSALARQARSPAAGQGVFLRLSEQLFLTLTDFPDVKVERLSYDAQEQALRLRLIYPDFEAATALEQGFAQRGAAFVTGGVREQNGVFIGDANLSAAQGT